MGQRPCDRNCHQFNFKINFKKFQVENVRAILRKELDLALVEIADPKAKLEGGDVLFTGKEFFVGISEFTNEAGATAVARAFPEFPVCPIKVEFFFIN